METLLFLALAAVVLIAGWVIRRRTRRVVGGEEPLVTDETLRRILEDGRVEAPDGEPLDEDSIREAEDEFWREEWDDPEPWSG